jgi:hypothetical protein
MVIHSVEECNKLLLTRQVQFLSLDNDLGSLDPKTEGFNVLNFLDELVNDDPTFPIPEITVHSSNASRAQSMRLAIQRLERIKSERMDP